jgi:hypothetical protein
MKNICLINGSLRGKEASSLVFLNEVYKRLSNNKYSKNIVTVRAKIDNGYPEQTFINMAQADVIILIFPLFSYGLPGALTRLLEEYYYYLKSGRAVNKETRVYAVINCGFPRPQIINEAIRVIKNFCNRLSFNWRFGICIGGGPAVAAISKVPFLQMNLKKAFEEIVLDIEIDNREEKQNHYIKPLVPEPILLFIKSQYEKNMK